ncbi:MAG: hypothetical protein FWC26_09315 [Fibromonadales bacterium]|nr:hypothetical protein [Fibromonadales bacterium]
MSRFFNIAGPCNPSEHYMLDPLRNFGNEFADLIDSNQYFVIHAARQSGKTTLLWKLANNIEAEGKYHALYCTLESAREMALGTKRADLCIVHEGQKYPIELKIKSNIKSYKDVFEQLSCYMDKVGSNEGWLVVFDKETGKSWKEKLYMDEKEYNGKHIIVVGA